MTEPTLTPVNGTKQPVMSSREIAELTGKELKHVHQDIWNMLDQLYDVERDGQDLDHHKNHSVTLIEGVIAAIDNRGYVSELLLDRRHTEILITGYDIKRRAAVIDRWFALESGAARPQHAVPQTLSEALMLAANLAKENEQLTDERDHAVRTKAQISEKREATACQRNSVYQRIANRAVKERDEMAALLGAGKEFASIRSVWRATGKWFGYRRLIQWQDEHDAMEAFSWDAETDARVLCYPREAWLEVYGIDIEKLF
ncbi:TPA: Rha family transcriptional regulator [Salmonella enterica subsp. enterica serovar 6,14:y:1,7]|nr:Rha family transcriptional regulator [Salmonella enterica subsp. enterica serovar 6,14:y:1,7]